MTKPSMKTQSTAKQPTAKPDARELSGSFQLQSGAELLREFESSPGQMRVFYDHCGPPLFKRYVEDPDRIRIRLGLLDVGFDEQPIVQVFASEKLRLTRSDESIPTLERGPGSPAYSPAYSPSC